MMRPGNAAMTSKFALTLLGIAVAALGTGCTQPSSKKQRQGSSSSSGAPVTAAPDAGTADQHLASLIKTVIAPHKVPPLQLKDDDQDRFARAHVNFSWNLFRR